MDRLLELGALKWIKYHYLVFAYLWSGTRDWCYLINFTDKSACGGAAPSWLKSV